MVVRFNYIGLEKYLYSIKSSMFIIAISLLLVLLMIRYKKTDDDFEKKIIKTSTMVIVSFLPIIIFDLINSIYISIVGSYGVIELKNDFRVTIMFYPPLILSILSVLLVIITFEKYIQSLPQRKSDERFINYLSTTNFHLSEREKSVVSLITSGMDNKTIAIKLDISVHTVKTFVKRIFQKTGLRSRYEIISHFKNSSHN